VGGLDSLISYAASPDRGYSSRHCIQPLYPRWNPPPHSAPVNSEGDLVLLGEFVGERAQHACGEEFGREGDVEVAYPTLGRGEIKVAELRW
jgi:hypothetical protein